MKSNCVLLESRVRLFSCASLVQPTCARAEWHVHRQLAAVPSDTSQAGVCRRHLHSRAACPAVTWTPAAAGRATQRRYALHSFTIKRLYIIINNSNIISEPWHSGTLFIHFDCS